MFRSLFSVCSIRASCEFLHMKKTKQKNDFDKDPALYSWFCTCKFLRRNLIKASACEDNQQIYKFVLGLRNFPMRGIHSYYIHYIQH